ncbi:MAG: ABC transporter permease [Anaerolineales bacterium]|jgi:ABC-2 type transport system permease protein
MRDRVVHDLKAIYTIWLRDVLRFSRDRSRILASLGQPLLFLFVFGGGLSPAMAPLGGGHIDFIQFMFPGILAMAVLFTSIFSAVSIVWDREFGFLKEVMVAPVSRVAVALGKVAGGSTVALFQGVLVMVFAPLLGIKLALDQLVMLIGLMLLLAVVMTSLGILIAARQKTMEGFHTIMNFVMLPMFFLSGAFFPLTGVPLWMDLLSKVNPVTYGVDPLRQVALQGSLPEQFMALIRLNPLATDIVVMLGFGLVFLTPAVVLFSRRD